MFVFGKRYAGTVGEVSENELHKNVAYIIIMGKTGDVTVVDNLGAHHTAPVLMITPLAEHSVIASGVIACHIFIAPYSAFADSLGEYTSDNGIVKLPANVLPFNKDMDDSAIFDKVRQLAALPNDRLDPRLAAVLCDLDDAPFKTTLVEIAALYDISPSRLRALAQSQLGISLSNLILWRKLVKSMEILASGSTLSEATQAGGFCDQAHFTRTVRKMFGITPSNSTDTLRH